MKENLPLPLEERIKLNGQRRAILLPPEGLIIPEIHKKNPPKMAKCYSSTAFLLYAIKSGTDFTAFRTVSA